MLVYRIDGTHSDAITCAPVRGLRDENLEPSYSVIARMRAGWQLREFRIPRVAREMTRLRETR